MQLERFESPLPDQNDAFAACFEPGIASYAMDSSCKIKQNASKNILAKYSSVFSKLLGDDESEEGSYRSAARKRPRSQCEFSNKTAEFLKRYQKLIPERSRSDGSCTYFIPLHGITSRDLPEHQGTSAKYFSSLLEIRVPKNAHNLDQCDIRRGPRHEISKSAFLDALRSELQGKPGLKAYDGALALFTHGCFSSAGVTDADSFRLAALSGVPTISLDWRSSEGPWFTLPFRYVLDYNAAQFQEKLFESALDDTLDSIGPERASLISFSRGAAFNASYLEHRSSKLEQRTKLKSVVMAHADLASSSFRLDHNGLNPITSASRSTIVLGNKHDKAILLGKLRIFGNRIGDAEKSDIEAVEKAGGRYLIDQFRLRGGNFNHYVNYKLIGGILEDLCLGRCDKSRRSSKNNFLK